MLKKLLSSILFIFLCSVLTYAQHGKSTSNVDNTYLKNTVQKFKKDIRGPYKAITWFCDDGTTRAAKDPCPDEVGGVQRASYKDETLKIADSYHVFLGQILATTNFEDFLDEDNYFSRLKQYQVEKYLKSVDDGWINRRAQFYRGSIQSEDEQEWGKNFFEWLLENEIALEKHYFTIREAAKDIPHTGDTNVAQKMRSDSKVLAEEIPSFMDIRIKIHGQPEASDIQRVKDFIQKNESKLTAAQVEDLNELVATMEEFFKPLNLNSLKVLISSISNEEIKTQINTFVGSNAEASVQQQIEGATDIMWVIRRQLLDEKTAEGRLAMLDISLKLENLITKEINKYPSNDLHDILNKICVLAKASAASGYTEIWEWQHLDAHLNNIPQGELTLDALNTILIAARKQLEWGTGKNRAVYGNVIELFQGFEPLTHGFLDDRIRSSVALSLGNSIGKLGNFISEKSNLTNKVLDISNQSHIHGLNPGYAMGELVIVEGETHNLTVNPNNIYIFDRPPSDLKPIAGILTVSEGNLVSHVQLLARNLGIPNAAISMSNVSELKKYQGQKVFYAVSNKGTVLIKPASEMTSEEVALFSKTVEERDLITVPVDKIKLDNPKVLNMRDVNALSSGIYCGPKAANLGELKELFPDLVVEGLVIPFGVFLEHMKQTIPNENRSYWDYLNSIFQTARAMKSDGESESKIEAYQLKELENLRKLIAEMEFLPSFIDDIETSFTNILGKPLGSIPVFLRSDTNMEDLKNFTGAGLNLTIFNVVEREKILNGIKSVWASPYTERSFKWRQKYLTNPENVYPSILVIPGVNNDYSGVMITKGVISGKDDEITVAFSKGVGGAVDGQAAETWVIKNNDTYGLMSPSREVTYKSLPATGGTESGTTSFENSILSAKNISDLYDLSTVLKSKMQAKNIHGPYDVELGFKDDKIWLFQVRPFVENKQAKSSTYLESITPKVDSNLKISLSSKI